MIVSNTAGAASYDPQRTLATDVEAATGVTVLSHATKKPGCGGEIMAYFAAHPETGVTRPDQIAVVGDRLSTDIMLANMLGGWGFWIRRGVVEHGKKSMVSVGCIVGAQSLLEDWQTFRRQKAKEKKRQKAKEKKKRKKKQKQKLVLSLLPPLPLPFAVFALAQQTLFFSSFISFIFSLPPLFSLLA